MADPQTTSRKSDSGSGDDDIVIVKKYANRRLYNTATSSYVTLDHLSQMVKDKVEFKVCDAKTGEDITRSVLTQIIVEEEGKGGQNLLPVNFLRQLIGFYGNNMQWMVPRYLEHSMESFAQNQERLRDYFQTTFGSMFPFGSFEEMGKQNMAMFESALRMFAPFGMTPGRGPMGGADSSSGASSSEAGGDESGDQDGSVDADRKLSEVQDKLAVLQRQLHEISKTRGGKG